MKHLLLPILAALIMPTFAHAMDCVDNEQSGVDLPTDEIGFTLRIDDIIYQVESVQVSPDGKTEQVELGPVGAHGAVDKTLTCQLNENK